MSTEDERPFDPEPWRRLAGSDEPPRATDERIRTAARQAVASRLPRWTLPASLAASLVLAVFLVRLQFDEPTPAAPSEALMDLPQASQPEAAAPAAEAEADAFAVPGDAVDEPPPPAPAAPTAPAREREGAPESITVTGSRAPAARPEARDESSMRADDESAKSAAIGLSAVQAQEAGRSPEEWYAAIEALRAAGRLEEAEAELARLEEAHPGWIERHLERER